MIATVQTTSRPVGLTADGGPTSAETLTGEHSLLMRDVLRRATPVLALLDTRSWPHEELGTLITFLRSAVLRQVSDEEVLLYPHDATVPPFAELSADHVRLHVITDRLERAQAEPCAVQELRGVLEELLTTLERHLLDEQAVLAGLTEVTAEVPSVAALAADERPWRLGEGPVLIPLDALPADMATQMCIERVLRLRPGQSAAIHSEDEDKVARVCRWLHAFDPARYGFERSASGREHALEVYRRDR